MTETLMADPELQNIREVFSRRTTLEEVLGEDRPKIKDPLGLLTATVDISFPLYFHL